MGVNRRNVLSGIATGTIGVIGGATLVNTSEPVEASVSAETLDISNAKKTTRDGTISDVQVELSGSWSYDVPGSKDPELWQVVLWVVTKDEQEPVGMQEGSAKYLSGQGDYSIEASVLASELYSSEDFAATEEGETKATDLQFKLVFNVFDPNENVIASSELETNATAAVENDPYNATEHGQTNGEGGLTIVA